MAKLKDLTGKRFGRLIVLKYEGQTKNHHSRWLVICDCGNQKVVMAIKLKNGDTQSCGCLQRERVVKANTTHGFSRGQNKSRAKLYNVWSNMKNRCENPANRVFRYYGARGITVCPQWQDYEQFHGWAICNGYQEGLTIDRKDNDGNYEPNNCRWATKKEQNNNKRKNIRRML